MNAWMHFVIFVLSILEPLLQKNFMQHILKFLGSVIRAVIYIIDRFF